jgi:hypothetical protein
MSFRVQLWALLLDQLLPELTSLLDDSVSESTFLELTIETKTGVRISLSLRFSRAVEKAPDTTRRVVLSQPVKPYLRTDFHYAHIVNLGRNGDESGLGEFIPFNALDQLPSSMYGSHMKLCCIAFSIASLSLKSGAFSR